MSFGNALQQVAGKVDPAALPDAALQLPADRLGEPCMGVRDHQPDATQAPLFEAGDEFRPEGLALAVAHLEAQQLPAAVLVDAHGDDDSAGADLQGLAEAALEVGGIQVDVGVAAALQRPAQKGLHLLIDLLTDAGSPEIPGVFPPGISGVPLRLTCDLEMPLWEPRTGQARACNNMRREPR